MNDIAEELSALETPGDLEVDDSAEAAPTRRKRKKSKQPTQRSLEYLRKQGYRAEVVEKWIPHTRQRKDLFGFIDIVAIRDGETLAVQATAGSAVAARVSKIGDAEAIGDVRKAGWRIVVHGWRKAANGRWQLREVDCS